MELTPTRDVYNPLLKRREVAFFVDHGVSATPKLHDVRKLLAARYGASEETVFVRKLETLTGTTRAVGEAELYDSVGDERGTVPRYIAARNDHERHKAAKEGGAEKEASKKELSE